MKQHDAIAFLGPAWKETFKRYWPHAILTLGAIGVGAWLAAQPSMVLKRFVDGPLRTGGEDFWKMAFLYLGVWVLIALTDLMREYSATVFGQKLLVRLRGQMLERLRILPMRYYWRTPAGDTLSRITADMDAVNTLFAAGLISAAADLLKIVGLLLALFALSAPLGGIALGALPVVYLLSDFFRRRIYQKQKVVRKRVSDINTAILETYAGLRILKTFGLERKFAGRFEPVLENHRLAMNGNSVYDAWFPCVMQIVRASVIALAMVFGASRNLTPWALGLSLGTLAAAADLFMRLFDPIEAAASELQTIQQAMAGLGRIREFFEQETNPAVEQTRLPAGEPGSESETYRNIGIHIHGANFSYVDGQAVLSGVSVDIPPGTKAAIAGRTGSGKTTLLQLVAGLYPASEGVVRVGGMDPYRMRPEDRRRLIGIVPQSVDVFHGSVFENITLRDRAITREQVERALEQVGLRDAIHALPKSLDTMLGEGETKLSHGQNQLLSLARAIVTDPPVLLLDELTSGLDTLTERQVLDAIRMASGERTILTISHRLSGILDAQVVHIMEHGHIVESGAPEMLSRQEGWFSRYRRLEEYGWRV